MDDLKSVGIGPLEMTESDLSPATELFSDPKDDLSMVEGRFIVYDPTNNSDSEYDFTIPPTGMTYLQLSATRIYVRARIVQENGANIIADDEGKVAFVNMPLAAMFSRIEVSLDGSPQADLSNSYSNYKGFLETMMSYSQEAADNHLSGGIIIMDTPSFFNNFTGEDNTNEGFQGRSALVGRSSVFELMGQLHSDFFQIKKFFPPGIKLTVRLTRAPDNFVICTSVPGKRFKLKVEKILLHVRHVTMSDALLNHHQKLMASDKKLIIPYSKTEIRAFTFNQSSSINLTNVVQENLPRQIVFGFVRSANVYGSYTTNPWYFEHLDVDNLFITVGGVMVPSKPYTPDFNNNIYAREYRGFMDNIGLSTGNHANMISPALYNNGLTLFAHDLTPDMCNGFHQHPRRTGCINIEAHFRTQITESVTAIVMCIYPAKLELVKKKIVTALV